MILIRFLFVVACSLKHGKFKIALCLNLQISQPGNTKETVFKSLSAKASIFILNEWKEHSVLNVNLCKRKSERLSRCALEVERKIWKCTCSKRHYMTLNINSSVVQREQRGINVSDENTVVSTGNFDPVKIDALKMLRLRFL